MTEITRRDRRLPSVPNTRSQKPVTMPKSTLVVVVVREMAHPRPV